MADESFRCRQEVVEADTESDLLDDLVGIFGIEVVFYCLSWVFAKVFWHNLDQVRNLCL